MTLEEIFNRLRGSKRIVLDLETSGLDFKRNHVVGWVLTFGPREDESFYVPLRHAGGGNIEGCSVPQTKDGWDGTQHPFEKEVIKELNRPNLEIGGHNLSFDLKFAYKLGLVDPIAKFNDSIINAPLLNEYASSFALDACCKAANVVAKRTTIYDYLISRFPELKTTPKQSMGHYWRLAGDDPQAVDYAQMDGTATWALLDYQAKQLDAQELNKVHAIESRLIPVLVKMSCRGIKIDEERLDAVTRETDERIEGARRALPEGFNSRAPSQVQALMTKYGYMDWPLTPKGKPSFPEQWLLTNDVGQNIVKLRKFENLRASFLMPMKEQHLWKGRCHPEYNQLRGDEFGTITGRLSSSAPNLQQVNKRNKELGALHRSIFVPDEGKKWGSADYKAMEPRLLAYYSRCKVLMDGFRATPSVDPHQAVANMTGLERETAKRINQTLITGGGKNVLVTKYGVPADKVDGYWTKYFAAMPEIKLFQRKATNRMRERGYVVTLSGRRCRMADKDYVALNRLLQGGNSDCLKYKMTVIDDFLRSVGGDSVQMLSNCHDALEFQFSDEKVYNRCLEIMVDMGEDSVISLDCPIEVDHKEGKSWSEATWGPE